MGKEILVIDNNKPLRKKPFAFTPQVIDQIEKLASLMCTLSEIGDIIGCSHDTIQRNQEAKEAIKRGVANAKHTIRKTQFDIATKLNSSIMAMWLGKVYLGQTDKIQNTDDNIPLPIYDIVDESKEVIEMKEVENDTISK
jgi:hypothetical protein